MYNLTNNLIYKLSEENPNLTHDLGERIYKSIGWSQCSG